MTPQLTWTDDEYRVDFDGFALIAERQDDGSTLARLLWTAPSDDVPLDPDTLRRIGLEAQTIGKLITRL